MDSGKIQDYLHNNNITKKEIKICTQEQEEKNRQSKYSFFSLIFRKTKPFTRFRIDIIVIFIKASGLQ